MEMTKKNDYLKKTNTMKKITTTCLIWLPMAFMLLLSSGLRAQCGIPPTAVPGTIYCYAQQTNVQLTLGLLGGPYNIQAYIDYQFPTIPIAPYATNYAAPTYTLTNQGAGTYTIYIVDIGHGGCYDSATYTLSEPAILNFTQGVQFPENCSDLAEVAFTASGGSSPYIIEYTQNNSTFTMLTSTATQYLPVGPYAFKLTDSQGCTVDQTATVFGISANSQSAYYAGLCGVTDSALSYTNTATIYRDLQLLMKGIGSFNDQLGFSVDWGDGTPATTYTNTLQGIQQTYPNGVPVSHTYTNTGVYQVTYTYTNIGLSNSGQIVEFISFNSDVYPGDANSDGVANNMDVLNIGLGFGASDVARPGASNSWTAQSCADWTQNFASGLNYKHADCDGTGLIDYPDTNAIVLNYGQSHVLSRLSAPQQTFVDPNDPTLAVRFPSGTYSTGSSVSVPITLGTAAVPATNIYGIAFTVNYPSTLVDASNVNIDFSSCWMGTSANLLNLYHNSPASSSIDVAISLNDHLPVTGFGNICSMNVITIDNVSGKLLAMDAYFTLSNIRLIDNMGNVLPVNAMGDTISVAGSVGLSTQATQSNTRVYPNPAKESFMISSEQALDEVELTDILGKTILHASPNEKELRISTEQLEKGLYLLRIRSGNVVETRKIEITK
jgi:hypothetical protein